MIQKEDREAQFFVASLYAGGIGVSQNPPAKDQALCGIADRLAENLRGSDMPGRIGGEEFASFMPAVALRETEGFAERLRHPSDIIPAEAF
ncbi:MAG: diguanylate cyclase domain-containing protein [Methylocella sp.]